MGALPGGRVWKNPFVLSEDERAFPGGTTPERHYAFPAYLSRIQRIVIVKNKQLILLGLNF